MKRLLYDPEPCPLHLYLYPVGIGTRCSGPLSLHTREELMALHLDTPVLLTSRLKKYAKINFQISQNEIVLRNLISFHY